MHPRFSLLLLASFAPVAFSGAGAAEDPAGLQFFEKQIRPVLVAKCYKCHSAEAEKVKAGLLLDTREATRKGGDSGHAVVPGDLQESLLIRAIRYTDKEMKMPPEKSGGKLPDQVIKDFETWVKMGAPDPRDGASIATKKESDPNAGKNFWAFQPPRAAPLPGVRATAWPRNDIDRFILAGLEQKGIRPVPDADPRALLRRLYFDLVGLPPAPEEVEAFVRDPSPEALAKIVDRLLASPQFGERWARHWLDVARFAESTGKERNFTFPEAWRYRDYVIAAFNADKPYDEFIREQIAGDLLPAKDEAERREHLVATGFLALGPKGLNERNREQFRMDLIDEQIDATSRAVLGLTVACARCHDHKFDPIAQRDYYALAGIFRSTETRFGTSVPYGKKGQPNRHGTPLLALPVVSDTANEASFAGTPTPAPAPEPLPPRAEPGQRLKEFLANNPKRARRFASLPPARKAQLLGRFAAEKGRRRNAEAANTAAAPRSEPKGPQAMGVVEGQPADCRLLVRGELDQPGETVPRGFVSVLMTEPPVLPRNESGRRELAEWLVARSNPLTARVMVNRVWAHLFGQGLVATADNFGASGEKPSHPELLDFLAVKFSAPSDQAGLGWSLKSLVREILLSRTYQLSSALDPAAHELDPENRLLWRATPRRLDAEALRDAMLAASGQLDLKPGDRSIVATVGDAYIGRGLRPEIFTNFTSTKRSVYLPIVRDFVPEVLDLFDFAEPSLIVAARDVTNVPSQALYLMNNSFVRAQAAALAQRVLAAPITYPERIRLAYQLALSRPPAERELARAQQFLLGEARGLIPVKAGSKADAADGAWSAFCQALLASAEFRYLR